MKNDQKKVFPSFSNIDLNINSLGQAIDIFMFLHFVCDIFYSTVATAMIYSSSMEKSPKHPKTRKT